MERKIGETFEYEGKIFKVTKAKGDVCIGCFFNGRCFSSDVAGDCESEYRSGKKDVIFVEIQEQPHVQAEQPKELNLCEILKDCPKGTKLYSPIFGEVDFEYIRSDDENTIVITKGDVTASFTKEGFYYPDLGKECLLFPTKEQRDWSKFTAPWLKKERFDPKTLKPFDKVLCKNGLDIWRCDFFSSYMETYVCQNVCISGSYSYCIPYNKDTKHLVGTTKEAPDFYRYWEE